MLDPTRLDVMQPQAVVARLDLAVDAVVADVGAGPGAFTHLLARTVPRGRVIATDIDPRALGRLEEDARAAQEANIEPRLVTSEETGLRDGEVDLAFLCQVDHYLRDRSAYLAQLARAIRPGGRIVLLNYLKHRAVLEGTAAALGWRLLSSWEPAQGFYANVYAVR